MKCMKLSWLVPSLALVSASASAAPIQSAIPTPKEALDYMVQRFSAEPDSIPLSAASIQVKPLPGGAIQICATNIEECDLVRVVSGKLRSEFLSLAKKIRKANVAFRHARFTYESGEVELIVMANQEDAAFGVQIDDPAVLAEALRNVLFYSNSYIPFVTLANDASKRAHRDRKWFPALLPASDSNRELCFLPAPNAWISLRGFAQRSPEVMDGLFAGLLKAPHEIPNTALSKDGVVIFAPWGQYAEAILDASSGRVLVSRTGNSSGLPLGPYAINVHYE
jgi:hypothetical protein